MNKKVKLSIVGFGDFGRLMQILDIPNRVIHSGPHDDLFDMEQVRGKDGWDLFESIMFEDPYAVKVNQAFKRAQAELDKSSVCNLLY